MYHNYKYNNVSLGTLRQPLGEPAAGHWAGLCFCPAHRDVLAPNGSVPRGASGRGVCNAGTSDRRLGIMYASTGLDTRQRL